MQYRIQFYTGWNAIPPGITHATLDVNVSPPFHNLGLYAVSLGNKFFGFPGQFFVQASFAETLDFDFPDHHHIDISIRVDVVIVAHFFLTRYLDPHNISW